MIFRNFNRALFLLLAAAGMTGCLKEPGGGETPVPEELNQTTFIVSVPAPQIPWTRSIAGGAGEAVIGTIDLLVFKSDGTLSGSVAGTNISPVPDNPEYRVTFKAALTLDENAKTFVVLANVPASLVSSAAVVGNAKQTILDALIHSSTGKWKADAGSYTPIPMCGEVNMENIGSPVELTRMLARIDMALSEGVSDDFSPKAVYVANYNAKGYITQQRESVNVPKIPAGAFVPATTLDNAMCYDWTTGELQGEIYTYEAKANPSAEEDTGHAQAMCLIVKGTHDGTDYYYRVDFVDPATRKFMPVLRNHLYRFEITAVNGPGFPATAAGFQSALKSYGVMNNLKYNLHVVDQSGIMEMVYNGQHYLGVSQTAFNLSGNANPGNELILLTNAKDLSAVKTDSWITDLNLQPVSGGRYTLTFDVSQNGSLNRTGTIILTAGRLQLVIEIIQYPRYT